MAELDLLHSLTSAAPASACWSSDALHRFDWRRWGDEAVVYVLATGATHELTPAATTLLELLVESPGRRWCASELIRELLPEDVLAMSDGDRQAQIEALLQLLTTMVRLGLVDAHSPVGVS